MMNSSTNNTLKRFNTMERRPRMLKEFLIEKDINSCSSSGFKSLPRKPNTTIVEIKRNYSCNNSNSTFQTLVTTVMKNIRRKLSRKRNQQHTENIKIDAVKIKDIIRWKSFRDLVEEHHQNPLPPLDFHRYHVDSISTTCSSSCCGSSWSDSDFFNSSWEEPNDVVQVGQSKRFPFSPLAVGKDSVGPTEDASCQEYEQQSPVSVLQVGEEEFSTFDQILANIERRKQKFIQTVQKLESLTKFDLANLDHYDDEYDYDDGDSFKEEFEEQDWVEEKANQLLDCVKASCSVQSWKGNLDKVLLDYFREELAECRNKNRNDDEGFEWEMLRIAEDWINGSFAYDIGHVNEDAFIKDLDNRGRWNRFEEEQKELALEIETAILHSLVADLLDLDG